MGVSERKIRTIKEMVAAMLFDSGLPMEFWGEAARTAVDIINLLPSRAIKLTPHQLWYFTKPNIHHLRQFGSVCFSYIHSDRRRTFESKSEACLVMGYVSGTSKIWRLWSLQGQRIIRSANVLFDKGQTFKNYSSYTVPPVITSSFEDEKENIPPTNHTPCSLVEGVRQEAETPVNDAAGSSGRSPSIPRRLQSYGTPEIPQSKSDVSSSMSQPSQSSTQFRETPGTQEKSTSISEPSQAATQFRETQGTSKESTSIPGPSQAATQFRGTQKALDMPPSILGRLQRSRITVGTQN